MFDDKAIDSRRGGSACKSGFEALEFEAEFTSLVKAAAEDLGIQSLAVDLGWNLKVQVHTHTFLGSNIYGESIWHLQISISVHENFVHPRCSQCW